VTYSLAGTINIVNYWQQKIFIWIFILYLA
jgi:hypothetical protein